MRTVFLPAAAALVLVSSPAMAATLWVNDPALSVDAINTIVFGAKYRLSTTNFDQSLDSGGGTTLVGGQPNFLGTNRGNFAGLNGQTFAFRLEHRAGQGFIWSMTNPGGTVFTQAWGSFVPALDPAPGQSAALLPALAATGQVPGTLIAPGLPFNAIHLESRASLRSNYTGVTVTYSDLSLDTPGLTQVGMLQPGFALTPGGGGGNPNFPDPNADYHSQWFVADTDLAAQDFTIAGKVRFDVTGYTSGNIDEFVKFTLSGKWTDFTPPSNPIPEPATWGMLIAGFGLVGGAMRRQRAAIA